MTPTGQFHLVTLGCPKNEVDSDKLVGTLVADGNHLKRNSGWQGLAGFPHIFAIFCDKAKQYDFH